MPFTRSRNTSGAPLAVGTDGVALRRSSRTSSLSAPSTPTTATSRPSQASSSAARHLKSLSKAVAAAEAPTAVDTERESSSPEELAPTVASRVRSTLSRSRGADAVPDAAFAVVGASTRSPFVKRTPLFIQRYVHPQPALLLGAPLSPSRLVLATTPSLSPPSSSVTSSINLALIRDAPEPGAPACTRTKRARSSSGSSVGTPSPGGDEERLAVRRGQAVRRRLELEHGQHGGHGRAEQAQPSEQEVDSRAVAPPPVDVVDVALMIRQSSIALCLIADDAK